jgi:hypothetical protein
MLMALTKKQRQVSSLRQRVDISMANKTPPTGALKAVHTPHAAPQATKSRMSRL